MLAAAGRRRRPHRASGRAGQPRAALHELFGPNVVGTAEVIRLAITTRIKPVDLLVHGVGGDDRRPGSRSTRTATSATISAVRPVDDSYANGYGNSKWAGEVLLREAHDLCGLPVAVFRSDMILAHSR